MKENEMTDNQYNSILLLVKEMLKKCSSIEEAVNAIDSILPEKKREE